MTEASRAAARKYREKLKQQVLDRYGRSCTVCGFDDIRALQIDHVNGNGNAERVAVGGSVRFSGWNFYQYLKNSGFPDGYQTLCANHNFIKYEESKAK